MNWYKQSQNMPLFDGVTPIQKIEPKKNSGLVVKVFKATGDGQLSLAINGKPYSYQLPYSAQEIANNIMDAQARGRGKQVKRLIDSLDKYLSN